MAEKRMFSKRVTDSDAFIELPSTAQALYFHLNQGADDDGFNNQVQIAMLKAHASIDDLKILIMKNFVIKFETGVIVISHWRLHNTLRRDRYTPTNFRNELSTLEIEKNGVYVINKTQNSTWLPDGIPIGNQLATQYRVGENSIDKNRISTTTTICEQEACKVDSEEEPLTGETLEVDIYTYLEEAWGRTLSPFEYELLKDWKNDEITKYAIKESVKCNARSIKYVERIIENLKAKGIKTEAEAIEYSDNFKKKNRIQNKSYKTSGEKMKELEREILEEVDE